MTSTRWARGAIAPLMAALLLTAITAAPARGEDAASKTTGSCEQPCTHVEDCPTVTCECEHGTASGVAVCDTENTHCCGSAISACERFCEVNHQQWTGRFTPEAPPRPSSAAAKHEDPSPSPAACSEPCQEPKDCRTISCQCVHGTALDVAACDVTTHCCGNVRVVCEHYCGEKKDKWTGKLVEPAPRNDGSLLGEPDDGPDDLNP